MARCSNTLVGILNVFLFLLSIPMLCIGFYLSLHGSTQCARFLEKPMIFLGVFLMVVSIAGVIGSCCRVTWFLWLNLVLMCFLIVLLISFTIFAFVVSSKGAGETIPGKAYKEYRLETYSKWLQKRVSHGKNWNNIRSCLLESGFCSQLEKVSGHDTVSVFNKRALSSLESGCCKPSNDCNFIYVSPTNWTTTSSSGGNNSDCKVWDGSDSKKLCYDCEACKAGFLDSIKSSLESVAVGNIFILVFLIIFYATGCCAMRNNKKEDIYGSSHGSYKI